MKISNTIIGTAVIGLTLGVIFFLVPTIHSDAIALVIGVGVGVAASVPTAILLMALLRRERSERQQHQEQPRRRVIMICADGSRWQLLDDGAGDKPPARTRIAPRLPEVEAPRHIPDNASWTQSSSPCRDSQTKSN